MPSIRTGPRRRLTSRSDRVYAALTAAGAVPGAGTIPTLDPAHHGLAEKAWHDAALTAGFTETTAASWPCEEPLRDPDGAEVLYRHESHGVYRLPDGAVVLIDSSHGWFSVRVAAPSRPVAAQAVTTFQGLYPALFAEQDTETLTVPITFWVLSQFGPTRRLRRVEAARWADIARNYTQEPLMGGSLMRWLVEEYRPSDSGQLLIWHGPPGTGKTWALRALAAEWADWAEFHCITDPDSFFVKDPSYMVDVLLADSYETISVDGDIVTEAGDKWRVLVLEDTGELLSADAKERSGQGLSRLLNVVDGMIGQGLRILVIVTTNERLDSLHEAVTRPGRCAAQILFDRLSAEEASAWLGRDVDGPMSLAELYAEAAAVERLTERIETGDWENTPPLDPLTRAAVDAASLPLPEVDDEPEPLVGALPAADTADGAVAALAASHRATTEAITSIVASAQRGRAARDGDALTAAALEAVGKLADRPAPVIPAPVLNVTMPEQPVTVNVDAPPAPHVEVHVPAQEPPVVHVAAADAPHVDVHVAAAEAPQVVVNVPEQAPAPAPVVHVHPAAHAPPRPRAMRVRENPVTGERTFEFDDDADE